MRHILKFVLVTVFATGLASCSLFDVEFDTTLSGVMDINVAEPMEKSALAAFPFQSSTTINPGDDEDIDRYIDNIVDVGVDGIIAEVESVSKSDVSILTGSLFTITNGETTVTWTLDEDWLIEEGTTVTLDDVGSAYDDVEEILKGVSAFTVTCSGTSSQSGVYITIRIDIETTITGNPF